MKTLRKSLISISGSITLLLIISVSCTNPEETSPIEGTWKMILGEYISADQSMTNRYPGNIEELDQLVIYSGTHFMFNGRFKSESDSVYRFNYGGGTFAYDGENYSETLLYFHEWQDVESTLRFNFELKNDTIIKTGPLESVGEFNWTIKEVYVKVE